MKIKSDLVFPCRMYFGKMENAQEILQEVLAKKELIKNVSSISQNQSTEHYCTDYANPVRLETFEEGLAQFFNDFSTETNMHIDSNQYWTACYKSGGHHTPHIHKMSVFDSVNYSGVLYLDSLGHTQFFAPHGSCEAQTLNVTSEFGKVILFPAALMHSASTASYANDSERIIISFNVRIYLLNELPALGRN